MRCLGPERFTRYGMLKSDWDALLPMRDKRECKGEVRRMMEGRAPIRMGLRGGEIEAEERAEAVQWKVGAHGTAAAACQQWRGV